MAATAVRTVLHGGDQDDLQLLVERLDALEHLDAVHPRQPDVEEHQVDLATCARSRGPAAPSGTSMTS